MANNEQALGEIVEQLETAWNNSDSVAWSKLFAEDADFIHVLGGHFFGRESIEQGHRLIFDTVYKGSVNRFQVEKIRFLSEDVAIVFVFASLKVNNPGVPPQIYARPTLTAQRRDGRWEIVSFQNTIVTPEGNSALHTVLADKHPIKGHGPVSES
jgi:uncharacterized protein (TIGR02246 family)